MEQSPNLILINHPEEFKQGVRILMRTLRSKDGGKKNNPDRVAEKLVSRSPEEFDKIFEHLLKNRKDQERIYSTVDARNLDKAIRKFKYDQLDADYFDKESRNSFYIDIYNRWISALQSPQSRDGTLFLIDIDNGENDEKKIRTDLEALFQGLSGMMGGLQFVPKIVDDYRTKNGCHIITTPFNPSLFPHEVKKNSMILWAYEKESPTEDIVPQGDRVKGYAYIAGIQEGEKIVISKIKDAIESMYGQYGTFTGGMGYQGIILGIHAFQMESDKVRDSILDILNKLEENANS